MSKDSERFQVCLDGGMVAPEDAKVSVITATAMRGANVYEGLRAYWDEVRGNLFVWKLDQDLECQGRQEVPAGGDRYLCVGGGGRGAPPRRRPPARHSRLRQQLVAHSRRFDSGPGEGRVQLPELPPHPDVKSPGGRVHPIGDRKEPPGYAGVVTNLFSA